MSGRFFILLAAILPLVSCVSVGPDYERPETFDDTEWSGVPDGFDAANQPDAEWWKTFNDPLLERYITAAVRSNRTIAAAEARVRRAMALRRAETAGYGPQVDLEAGHSRRKVSRGTAGSSADSDPYRTEFDIGLSASWEIDLFGGVRRASEAAAARIESAVEERRAVLLAAVAEVARNYYAARGSQRRIATAEQIIELQTRTYDLIDRLFNLGEASAFDLSRARGQLEQTRSRLPLLDAELRAAVYRLSILTGNPPAALLDDMLKAEPLPALPDLLPIGQTSDLLRRRPDVRAAERELAAAVADIGMVTADLFPRFSLLGTIGRTSDTVEGLRDSLSTRYGFSQFISWPLFQSGEIRAEVRAEKAEAEEAAALYEQTVLEALADAESALVRYLRQRETRQLLDDVVASRILSVKLARQLFESGEENFLAVLDAERELINAEDELVGSEIESVLRLITLYASLGGGWEPFEASAPAGE